MADQSPVKDNGDKVFNFADVAALMAAEDRVPKPAGATRIESQHVHGIFDTIGIRQIMRDLGFRTLATPDGRLALTGDPSKLPLLAEQLNQTLTTAIDNANTLRAFDPNYIDKIAKISREAGEKPEKVDLGMSDARAFDAFAKDFKSQFPKGVKFSGDDIGGLISHFTGSIRVASGVKL